jgi:uncharacterized protein (DUF1330 family)
MSGYLTQIAGRDALRCDYLFSFAPIINTAEIMKTRYKLAIAVVAGAAVGGSIIQGIHAQATAPTYAVVDISTVTDPEGFKALVPKAGPAVTAFGGKFIVRSENITPTDGTPPKRFVIIAFDSLEKAKAWDASAAQREVTAIRMKSSASRQFLVEGMPQ